MKSAFFLVALLALSSFVSADIVLYRAGRGNRKLRTLYSGSCLPRSYITVRCTFGKWPGRVGFRVNGAYIRSETLRPYTIAGDRKGYSYPWKVPRGRKVSITCTPQFGRPQSVTVWTKCAPKIPVLKPKPRRKPRVTRKPRKWVYTPRKVTRKPRRKPRVTRKPRKWVYKPRKVTRKPIRKPIRKPFRKPVRKPVRRPVRAPKDKISRKNCVIIPFSKMSGKYSKKWEKRKWGIVYQPNNKFHGVYKPGTDPLVYKFEVPRKGRYAITLDMTTRHWTEWNDVFIKFDSCLDLRRYKKYRRACGYTKAYHNKNGRAVEAYSVDFDAHSFSTNKILYPKTTYTITIGARSTRLTLHRIIMFPCNGKTCDYHSAHWKKYVNICKA